MSKQYAVRNQKGNYLSAPYYNKIMAAYFKDKAFVDIDGVRIDIKGPGSDENVDRIVIDVFVHGLE